MASGGVSGGWGGGGGEGLAPLASSRFVICLFVFLLILIIKLVLFYVGFGLYNFWFIIILMCVHFLLVFCLKITIFYCYCHYISLRIFFIQIFDAVFLR